MSYLDQLQGFSDTLNQQHSSLSAQLDQGRQELQAQFNEKFQGTISQLEQTGGILMGTNAGIKGLGKAIKSGGAYLDARAAKSAANPTAGGTDVVAKPADIGNIKSTDPVADPSYPKSTAEPTAATAEPTAATTATAEPTAATAATAEPTAATTELSPEDSDYLQDILSRYPDEIQQGADMVNSSVAQASSATPLTAEAGRPVPAVPAAGDSNAITDLSRAPNATSGLTSTEGATPALDLGAGAARAAAGKAATSIGGENAGLAARYGITGAFDTALTEQGVGAAARVAATNLAAAPDAALSAVKAAGTQLAEKATTGITLGEIGSGLGTAMAVAGPIADLVGVGFLIDGLVKDTTSHPDTAQVAGVASKIGISTSASTTDTGGGVGAV